MKTKKKNAEQKLWNRPINNEDIDFTNSSREALAKNKVEGLNLPLFGSLLTIVALVVWACYAQVDEVTKGVGKVIPSSSIQTVQNLEGGILAERFFNEGDKVEKGQILARLDDTLSGASYEEQLARRDSLEAAVARLAAEAKDLEEISFSEHIVKNRPDLVKREKALFEKNRLEVYTQKSVFSENLKLAREELVLMTPLVREKIVPKVDLLRLQREVNDLEGRIRELVGGFQRDSLTQYNEYKNELEIVLKSIDGRKDTVDRTLVRSPVGGTVNKWHKTTVGGVVQPGEDIVDIVPDDGTLLVEAKVKPSEIAFLKPKQKAVVKISAFDFSIYGGLEGELETISADTILDEVSQEHFYQIKVRNKNGSVSMKGEKLDIIPGMVAEVDVITGRRTVMQYLTKPIHRMRFNALREN